MPSYNVTRNCTVKILDEVYCVFVGLHPDHLGYFYDAYARKAPNYFFDKRYKLGSWDGNLRYFWKNGKTYNQLLDEIIPRIVELGYKVKLIDERTSKILEPEFVKEDHFKHIIDLENDKPIILRPYQVDMVNTLIENGSGVGVAGTGAGKTFICGALVDLYAKAGAQKTLTMVPDKNLVAQTRDSYQWLGLDAGIYYSEEKDLDHIHIVSTWQSLRKVPVMMKDFDLVIVDECHGAKGNEITKLLNEHGTHIVHRFGVTGTLPKHEADQMSIRVALGPKRMEVSAKELIDQGWLAKLHIDIMELEVDLKEEYEAYLKEVEETKLEKPATYRQFKNSYFPDFTAEKRFLISDEERLEWIKSYIELKREAQRGNVLCFVDRIAFGKKLAKMLDAPFVQGKKKMADRRKIYNMFKDHDNLVVIANVKCAGTGLDISRIFNLMYIDMGKSFIRTIQSIGRGLRKALDKDFVHVTDICSDLKYSRRHLRERIGFYKEAGYPHKKRKVDYVS